MRLTAGLGDDELDGLYGWLADYGTLLAAVSGGPDSMALIASLARWQRRQGHLAPHVEAVTVDHGLRPESAAEAQSVADALRRLGVPHVILQWTGPKPATGVQQAARTERYRLLADHARRAARQPAAIVTAHHAEDQAETVLMRLARGSGMDGLAGMAPVREEAPSPGSGGGGDGAVPILRPLLAVAKSRLQATVAECGLASLDDPSNSSLTFERVRLRQAWPVFEAAGLSAAMIGRSASRLERARRALEVATDALYDRIVDEHDGTHATILAPAWRDAAEDLRIRLLTWILVAFGGQERAPRLSQVEDVSRMLDLGRCDAGVTLGGCVIVAHHDAIEVFRESGRNGLPEVVMQPDGKVLWDRRFEVGLSGDCHDVIVRALGGPGYAQLKLALGPAIALSARAAITLPSLWRAGRLIAVPHLDFTGPGVEAAARFVGRPRRWMPASRT